MSVRAGTFQTCAVLRWAASNWKSVLRPSLSIRDRSSPFGAKCTVMEPPGSVNPDGYPVAESNWISVRLPTASTIAVLCPRSLNSWVVTFPSASVKDVMLQLASYPFVAQFPAGSHSMTGLLQAS